jgi:hypothetical protein
VPPERAGEPSSGQSGLTNEADERSEESQVSEVDPDPTRSDEGAAQQRLGGRDEPASGDPTDGGKRGQIGNAPSVASDEPHDGGPALAPGGGSVTEDPDEPPVAAPGPDA